MALFQNNKSQNQISHYLSQIRIAINKDFVPFYLGSKKDIGFYLSHNNTTTKILHKLKKNDLLIIVDSTYLRLEKSSNNHFQYSCWSQQKMDLLIKPFIICCADGFIIDCYGPFQANLNDAKIFEYILETDKSLLSILKPHHTVVLLDRGILFLFFLNKYKLSGFFYLGFRDIFKKLRDIYCFIPKIPTCNQLFEDKNVSNETKRKNKQLSTKETSDNRLVT